MTTLTETVSTESATSWFIQNVDPCNGTIRHISIPNGCFRVGRRTDINLCLPFSNISKLHAEIVANDEALFIRDLQSTNGTFVNGCRIEHDAPIGAGDVIHFADQEFVVGFTKVADSFRTMSTPLPEWRSTLVQFHKLITERAVTPYFQPIVDFADQQIIGYEVLARSSFEGLFSPRELFTAAERVSLSARLSELCRECGVDVAQRIANPGLIFLNTHPKESLQNGLLESLVQLRTRAPQLEIVLELHEAAITNVNEIRTFRDQIKDLSIQLAFDDFGAGQARLLELSEVAPDFLKFDIELIRDIHLVPQRQQLVAGLVQTVRELGILPLAEGIETNDEAIVCRQIGFTHAQGFFYGKPSAVG